MNTRRRPLACGLACLLGAAAAARAADDPLSDQDRGAIRDVISRQLDAFRADDGETAFSFASPGIRRRFGDAGTFLRMVREGYRPVYRPRSVTFGALERIDDLLIQRVRLVGPDGRRVVALYAMERQPDGTWRIDGCQLIEPDDEAA